MNLGLKQPRCRVFLIITGDKFDPQKFTESLGIKPDYYNTSEDNDIQGKPLKGNWQLNSKLPATAILEEHVLELLKEIAPARQNFKKLTERLNCCFYCSVEFSDKNTDGFKLTSRAMNLLGSLGIDLQFDVWKEEAAEVKS